MCASISCGRPVMIIVSGTLLPVPVLCVLGFVFTFRWASLFSVHLVVVAILFVSGALVRGALASIVDGNLVVHLWVHCLLDAGFPRLSLASSFHHIARHQIRGVSPRALAFLPSGLCFSRLSFGLLWRCSIVPVFPECWPLRSCLALLFHQIARYQSRHFLSCSS